MRERLLGWRRKWTFQGRIAGVVSSGRRSGQRFDATHGVATEAVIFLGELDPEAIGPALADATHYEAVPPQEFHALVQASPLDPARCTFVDVGSGMGRAVMLASQYPFKQIVGLEISPALHEIARDNLRQWRARGSNRAQDIRLVCADARTWKPPKGDVVFFLYNPFNAAALRGFLSNLGSAAPREIVLLYHTPAESAVLEAVASRVAELPCGTVYRLNAG